MKARRGFTLIEILAVIVILGILATVLLTQFGSVEAAAEVQRTRQRLAQLNAVAEAYANEFGEYPPSHFSPEQGVANDGTNVGVEALVVALWSRGWEAGGLLGDLEAELVNTDGDRSSKHLTDFGVRSLLEIPDTWGNPIAYIRHDDYPVTSRAYVTFDPATGDEIVSIPLALENPTTGRYYRPAAFQFLSAGLDGEFGTDDDITPFEHD